MFAGCRSELSVRPARACHSKTLRCHWRWPLLMCMPSSVERSDVPATQDCRLPDLWCLTPPAWSLRLSGHGCCVSCLSTPHAVPLRVTSHAEGQSAPPRPNRPRRGEEPFSLLPPRSFCVPLRASLGGGPPFILRVPPTRPNKGLLAFSSTCCGHAALVSPRRAHLQQS